MENFKELWLRLDDLLHILHVDPGNPDDPKFPDYKNFKVKIFVEFSGLSCQGKALEYGRLYKQLMGADAVTPYVHTLVLHVYQFLKQYGTIIQFSMQSLEAKNGHNSSVCNATHFQRSFTQVFFFATNRHDGVFLQQIIENENIRLAGIMRRLDKMLEPRPYEFHVRARKKTGHVWRARPGAF